MRHLTSNHLLQRLLSVLFALCGLVLAPLNFTAPALAAEADPITGMEIHEGYGAQP